MPKLSVCIIAYNEEDKIADAIKSVLWADEIIVADSYSTDATAKIAAEFGAKVVQIPFKGFYGRVRNQAVEICQHEWIFSLDADERCTEEAKSEICSIIEAPNSKDVYHIPRRNLFFGRWVKHAWAYPDYRQPQLFRKGTMTYQDGAPHDGFNLHTDKPVGYLKHDIWQVPFKNISEIFYKADRYSTLAAEALAREGKKSSVLKAISHAVWAFIKFYFLKRGFLDGWQGFLISVSSAEGSFYRYIKLKVLTES